MTRTLGKLGAQYTSPLLTPEGNGDSSEEATPRSLPPEATLEGQVDGRKVPCVELQSLLFTGPKAGAGTAAGASPCDLIPSPVASGTHSHSPSQATHRAVLGWEGRACQPPAGRSQGHRSEDSPGPSPTPALSSPGFLSSTEHTA